MSEQDRIPKINVRPDECDEKLREALWILYKLRKYKKIWDEKYGVANRDLLRTWEDRADEFLKKIIIKPEE